MSKSMNPSLLGRSPTLNLLALKCSSTAFMESLRKFAKLFISAVVIQIFWTKRITRKLIPTVITNLPVKWTNSTLIKSPLKMPTVQIT